MDRDLLSSFRLSNGASATARAAVSMAQENLASARDPSYVKRIPTVEVDVSEGHISGLRNGLPQRVVDLKIVAAKRDQNSVVQSDDVKKTLLEKLDDLTGSIDNDEGAIHKKLINLASKAAALTSETSSSIGRRNTIEAMKEFADSVQGFAKGINDHRNFAERGVMESVVTINTLTSKLFSLNKQLIQIASSGHGIDLSNLDNEREKIVESIAKVMDIQVVYSENNIYVYTSNGLPLVENKLYALSYQSSGNIDYSAEYPVNINPIYLEDDKGGKLDITPKITKGQLGGYLAMRDVTYPSYQKTLDKFVETFKDKVNHIHNQGSGFPPATELKGKSFVAAADKDTSVDWKADGKVRIAFVDDKGKFSDSGGAFYVDLNLNLGGVSPLSPSEIRNQINVALGAGVATFSESNDHGYLTLKAPAGLRIAIGSVDGQPLGETVGGVGFSEYFRLNDLFESTADSMGRGHSNTFHVSSRIASDAALFSAGRLNSSASIALTGSVENTVAIASGDGRELSEFRNILSTQDISFPAVGVLSAQTTSFMEYLSNMVNVLHLETSTAIENLTFSENLLDGLEQQHSMVSGVNQDEEMSEILMQQIYYSMLMKTSQKLLEMIHEMLEVMGRN